MSFVCLMCLLLMLLLLSLLLMWLLLFDRPVDHDFTAKLQSWRGPRRKVRLTEGRRAPPPRRVPPPRRRSRQGAAALQMFWLVQPVQPFQLFKSEAAPHHSACSALLAAEPLELPPFGLPPGARWAGAVRVLPLAVVCLDETSREPAPYSKPLVIGWLQQQRSASREWQVRVPINGQLRPVNIH